MAELHNTEGASIRSGKLSKLLFPDITDSILGAFYATHNELGPGFLESIYRNATAILLRHAGRRV